MRPTARQSGDAKPSCWQAQGNRIKTADQMTDQERRPEA